LGQDFSKKIKNRLFYAVFVVIFFLLDTCSTRDTMAQSPIVIAHRGASGYLPEHTLAAKAVAHAQGADYLEQDVVLTRDDVPVVLHDIHLDTVTDVADRFPGRQRPDGRYYAIDFSWDEIQTLRVYERVDLDTGQPVYPGRFPGRTGTFRVPSLTQEIEFIQGLNRSTGRTAGLYPEIKSPAFHRQAGKDISRVVLEVLNRFGYVSADDPVFVQCFDAQETRRLREELRTPLRLVQLIGENAWQESTTDYDQLRTPAGLREVARYANAIGPWIPQVIAGRESDGRPILTDLVRDAHATGLAVHPYTARWDDIPDFAPDPQWLVSQLFEAAAVDGLFCDFPDRALALRHRQHSISTP
jgi:glycerophosphoryl diester phosphodiesterase